jgi:hypothetical protein
MEDERLVKEISEHGCLHIESRELSSLALLSGRQVLLTRIKDLGDWRMGNIV